MLLFKKLADKGSVDGPSLAKLMATDKREYTIGEVLSVALPRPRSRVALAENTRYLGYRKAVLDFLYTRQGRVEKAA